ncbi:hypothetical protein [Falsiroseomonas sp. E2-1-a20]|uniref:hypothetical protein n=1 Tax=Falsiroseomonas sp. E2-1-a20 TaxID=3239300 RepID=UPI003F325C12
MSPLPWHAPTPPGFHADFETPAAAEQEDLRRITILRRVGGADHLALAERLADGNFHEQEPTLASSRYMRVARIRLLSTAAQLLEVKQGLDGLFFVTLVPQGCSFSKTICTTLIQEICATASAPI